MNFTEFVQHNLFLFCFIHTFCDTNDSFAHVSSFKLLFVQMRAILEFLIPHVKRTFSKYLTFKESRREQSAL